MCELILPSFSENFVLALRLTKIVMMKSSNLRISPASICILAAFLLASAACQPATLTPAAPTATSTVPPPAPLWTDENAVMSGLCFESAYDAAGQVFILRSAEEHIQLYDLADNSQLCSEPVMRNPFSFDGRRVLAGLWNRAIGCTGRHQVLDFQRDDAAKRILMRVQFVPEGECGYEVVVPFWIGLENAADFVIEMVVEP